jgi:hypothetical protein
MVVTSDLVFVHVPGTEGSASMTRCTTTSNRNRPRPRFATHASYEELPYPF